MTAAARRSACSCPTAARPARRRRRPPTDEVGGEEGPAAPGTLQIVVAEPGEQDGPDAWSGSEEQLFVQELHRLHAED